MKTYLKNMNENIIIPPLLLKHTTANKQTNNLNKAEKKEHADVHFFSDACTCYSYIMCETTQTEALLFLAVFNLVDLVPQDINSSNKWSDTSVSCWLWIKQVHHFYSAWKCSTVASRNHHQIYVFITDIQLSLL